MLGLDTLVITGTSCAGKTTVAAEVVKRVGAPAALVHLDAIRAQIVVGALSVWSPFPPTDAALGQWAAAIEICGDMARRYRDRGWSCVIDAPGIYVDDNPWPPFRHSAWAAALNDVAWTLVVLHPTLNEVERRASIRRGEPAEGDPRLGAMHAAMEEWRADPGAVVVDPTGLDVASSADLIIEALHAMDSR
jgi:predicted kinase